MGSKCDVIVVGAGQAAAELVWTLRTKGFCGSITVIGREAHEPYERPPLSKRCLKEDDSAERLYLRGLDAYAEAEIELRTGLNASRLDSDSGELHLSNGERIEFGVCVLATGSRPRMPRIAGTHLRGIHVLRTIDDSAGLRRVLRPGAKIVVLGGGYLGLEAAAAAKSCGCDVTVIESAPRILARSLSETAARALEQRHRGEGVNLVLKSTCVQIEGNDAVTAVRTDVGERYLADAVLVAIGAEPEIELAASAGLACENGILVSAECRTSAPKVYAIGDCANQLHPRYDRLLRLESVQNALFHARCAAASILRAPAPPAKPPTFWSNQYDLKIQLAGVPAAGVPCTDVISGAPSGSFVVERIQAGRLVAVEAVNSPSSFIKLQQRLDQAVQ